VHPLPRLGTWLPPLVPYLLDHLLVDLAFAKIEIGLRRTGTRTCVALAHVIVAVLTHISATG